MKKLLLILLIPLTVFAVPTDLQVTKITWDPLTTTKAGLTFQPDGYKVYCGASPGIYTVIIDVGLATEYILDSKIADGVNYCSVSVYKGAIEGENSEEVIIVANAGKYERDGPGVVGIRLE